MAFLTMESTLPPRTNCTHTRVFAWLLLLVMLSVPSVSLAQSVTAIGRVELTGAPSPRTADVSDAVVWLNRLGDATEVQPPRSQRRLRLVQKNKSFSPHVLVVQVGQPVEFPNSDPFFHNVFSLFEGKPFDLGLYEAGSSRTVVFNRTGISYIFCNIHPEMSAVVVALKTPYYAISDHKGTITIPNVPPGRYQIEVWHERVLPETLNALEHIVSISEASSSLGVLRLPEERSF